MYVATNETHESQDFIVNPSERPGLGELHMSSLIGGTHGRNGSEFMQEIIPVGWKLTGIQANVGENNLHLVRGIRFSLEDSTGAAQEKMIGDERGEWLALYNVPDGAELVGISGASGWYIDAIQFHFSDGSATPSYGGSGGDTIFDIRLNKKDDRHKGRIRGFYGSRDRQGIETLGLVFEPGE